MPGRPPPKNNDKRPRPPTVPQDFKDSNKVKTTNDKKKFEDDDDLSDFSDGADEGGLFMFGDEGILYVDRNGNPIVRHPDGAAPGFHVGDEGFDDDDDDSDEGLFFGDDDGGLDFDEEDLELMDEMFGGDQEQQEQFIREYLALKQKEQQQQQKSRGSAAAAAKDGNLEADLQQMRTLLNRNGGDQDAFVGDDDDDEDDEEGDGDDDGDDDDDDQSNASHVDVNFSVDNMVKEDVPLVANLLDANYIPDPDCFAVDVTKLAQSIQEKGVGTSIVMEEDDEDEGDDDDENNDGNDENDDMKIYGVLSLLRGSNSSVVLDIAKFLESAAVPAVAGGVSDAGATNPGTLLRAGNGALVVSHLFSQLPPVLIARLFDCFVNEVTEACSKAPGAAAVGKKQQQQQQQLPSHVVFLSKTALLSSEQAEKNPDKTPLSARGNDGGATASSTKEKTKANPGKKARVDTSGEQYVQFARFEDDIFYRHRDAAATQVLMGQYTRDKEDHKRCVVFALTWKRFVAAVQQVVQMVGSQQ